MVCQDRLQPKFANIQSIYDKHSKERNVKPPNNNLKTHRLLFLLFYSDQCIVLYLCYDENICLPRRPG